jgi:hypothetical protein
MALKMENKKVAIQKETEVKITLEGNKVISGSVNIDGFDRFSDYIEHNEKNIKIYNGTVGGNKFRFLIIPKDKICYYEPLKESS